MRTNVSLGVVAALLAILAMTGTATAAPIIVGSVGGAALGAIKDNLDWLPLGIGGGTSGSTGITVSFTPDAQAVTGAVGGQYAAPWVSGSNGVGFGNPDGADTTTYITSGRDGSPNLGANAQILLPGLHRYFGLLWGSVDNYNTLRFYDNATWLFDVTGSQVTASPNGNQGVNGTLYVNITNDVAFNRVVATSSNYAFEFDNVAFGDPVPEPASMVLFGTGLVGLASAARRRMRK